jgi:signal transduction histidine kinase/CheY-like chemotaxis protein
MFFAVSFFALSYNVCAAQRTVRVGISDTDNTGISGENETVLFQKDYLQAISEYADWKYEYVSASWDELLKMVRNGKIDLLMDVTKTDERMKYYNFSSEAMGTEMCYLFGRSDTKYNYNDYKAFNGMKVGYEKGSTVIDELQKYGRRKGFSVKPKPYKSGAAMFRALDAGKVDTVVQTNYFETPEGHVILAKCSSTPVYFITSKKDSSLSEELDDAMAQLFSYNPSFNSDIFELHFGRALSKSVGYTKEEHAYMDKKPVVYVYYETNWAPFEYETGGKAEGITPDIIRAIGKETGIKFKFILSSSTKAVYDDASSASNDLIMAVSYDYSWAKSHGLLITEPYVSGSVMRVAKDSGKSPATVAVVKGGYLEHRISKTYPKLKEVPYLTFGECMDAVADGDADCTFLNYYQANYYRSMGKFESFVYQPVSDITQSISLGVTEESNPLLLGILSKSLQSLSADTIQSILSENSTKTEQFSFGMMMRRYPVRMAAGIAAFGIGIGLIIFLLVSLRIRKRQNRELAEAKAEAEAANRAKSEFLSSMSHDLRTPLNGIIGFTDYAMNEHDADKKQDYLSKVKSSGELMRDMVNDTLELSRIESGKGTLDLQTVDLQDVAETVMTSMRPYAELKRLELTDDFSGLVNRMVLADKIKIQKIILNLVSNAIKYTGEGGSVAVVMTSADISGSGSNVSLTVKDNGIGMSEEFCRTMFEPFTQEKRAETDTMTGTGLGLSIVRKYVDLMGGTVDVKSKIHIGTEVTVVLPLKNSDEGVDVTEKPAVRYEIFAGKHALLFEDNNVNAEIAQMILGDAGVITDRAADGKAGLEMYAGSGDGYYDFILMDIRMPVMNGFEAAAAIRGMDRSDAATVPVIAMTADAFEESMTEAAAAGMNGYITKPIDRDAMFRTIAENISK